MHPAGQTFLGHPVGVFCLQHHITSFPVYSLSVLDYPFGLENGVVSNENFVASAFYSYDYEPHQGKLNNLLVWCAKVKEWIPWFQVNLGRTFFVTGIATQGDPTWPPNYTKKFILMFSFDGLSFTTIRQEHSNTAKVISICLCVSAFAMPTPGYYFVLPKIPEHILSYPH